MSTNIDVTVQTQHIVVDEATQSSSVTNAGPPGPPGPPGSIENIEPILEAVDDKIATHNQATPVHPNATSGRDFVALFQNGLV